MLPMILRAMSYIIKLATHIESNVNAAKNSNATTDNADLTSSTGGEDNEI